MTDRTERTNSLVEAARRESWATAESDQGPLFEWALVGQRRCRRFWSTTWCLMPMKSTLLAVITTYSCLSVVALLFCVLRIGTVWSASTHRLRLSVRLSNAVGRTPKGGRPAEPGRVSDSPVCTYTERSARRYRQLQRYSRRRSVPRAVLRGIIGLQLTVVIVFPHCNK